MPKGTVVHAPSAAFERIAKAIRSLEPGVTFEYRDVRRIVPDVSEASLRSFLLNKYRAGWLERPEKGWYRVGGISIRTSLPLGICSGAVWAALVTDPERKFRSFPEITGDAEVYIGRPEYRAYHSVAHVLNLWHRDGALERIGPRGQYRYRLKEGVTEQPITRS